MLYTLCRSKKNYIYVYLPTYKNGVVLFDSVASISRKELSTFKRIFRNFAHSYNYTMLASFI